MRIRPFPIAQTELAVTNADTSDRFIRTFETIFPRSYSNFQTLSLYGMDGRRLRLIPYASNAYLQYRKFSFVSLSRLSQISIGQIFEKQFV